MIRIDEARQRQPIEELRRKANKSTNKAGIWTQEDIDLAVAMGREFDEFFGSPEWGKTTAPLDLTRSTPL